MAASALSMNMSNTSSSFHKNESVDRHFRWASVYKFIVLASVFSSTNLNTLDMFSKEGELTLSIFESLLFQLLVCAPYMFMDCFIKQYTKKMNGYTFMNPLLRGIQFGIFFQTAFIAILASLNICDLFRVFGQAFKEIPNWSGCHIRNKEKCISLNEIFYKCYYKNDISRLSLTSTSAHYSYKTMFKDADRNSVTQQTFFAFVLWMANFFITSVADETLYMICGFTHLYRTISTLAVMTVILITHREIAFEAFGQIMAWDGKFHYDQVLLVSSYAYSIGRLSFYDYEVLSPYTMTDNAVIFYMIEFNIEGMIRSWIFSSMVINLKKCIEFGDAKITNHYYLLCILPLSAEFMPLTRVYTLFIYSQLLLSRITQLSMITLSMAKLLQSEFRSVKIMNFVGLLSFAGVCFTIFFQTYVPLRPRGFFKGIFKGLQSATALVAFLKVFVIVVFYGIQRFSKDIHFWLGFKLTKYWELTWTLLPVTCLGAVIFKLDEVSKLQFKRSMHIAISWVVFTLLIVAIINIRTIALYLMNNVLGRAFVASAKYGPPDPEDRKKRREFDETIELRRCRHLCQILDEEVDCNHLSLMTTMSLLSADSESLQDITSIYKRRNSIALDIENP